MNTRFVIDTTQGELYYSITYLTAVLLFTAMTIYAGFEKGYPKIPWFLLIMTGGLFFMIGEKTASYSMWQWKEVFTGFHFPPAPKKTILGGIIGLFAGLILARTWLRFNRSVLDLFAIALPVAMAISRIGCLMAGCCFGTTTNLPWGIAYGPSSAVFNTHRMNGLVHFHDKVSAVVHPIQVYELLGCLVIAFFVWLTRKQWKAGGSLFLFSVLGYAFLRFLIEFIRDPGSSFVLTQVFFGMKTIQWVIMGFMAAGISVLVIRETGKKHVSEDFPPIFVSNFRQILLALFLSSIALYALQWFTVTERSMILFFLGPVIMVILLIPSSPGKRGIRITK